MSDLCILVVTRAEGYALPFIEDLAELAHDLHAPFVVAADGEKALRRLDGLEAATTLVVRSHGYLESVLDTAVAACPDGHILRLDDDERVSDGMYQWLLEHEWEQADHWAFPRANLYPDEHHRLAGTSDGCRTGGTLWPDLQTRLSVKAKAGGRTRIHAGSPHGTGRVAPVVIEHHKLLVRTLDERVAQADAYEKLSPGAGRSMTFGPFQTPELFGFEVVPYVEMVPA